MFSWSSRKSIASAQTSGVTTSTPSAIEVMEETNTESDVDVDVENPPENTTTMQEPLLLSSPNNNNNNNNNNDHNSHENGTEETGSAATTANSSNGSSTTISTPTTSSSRASRSPSLPSISRLVSVGFQEGRLIFLSILLMIFSQVAQLISPRVLGHAYDALVSITNDNNKYDIDGFSNSTASSNDMHNSTDSNNLNDDTFTNKMERIRHYMMLVLLLHGAAVVASFVRGVCMGVAGERIVARLRLQLYTALLRQDVAFYDQHASGDLVSRLGSDTTVVKQALSSSWAEVGVGIVRLLTAVVLMCTISPRLTALTVGCTFVIFLTTVPLGRALAALSKKYQAVLGKAQSYPTEALGAMRTVQAFAAEQRELDRYESCVGNPDKPTPIRLCHWEGMWSFGDARSTMDNLEASWSNNNENDKSTTYSLGIAKTILSTGFHNFIWGFGFGAMYVSLWYGFYLVNENYITLGELTAFQSYIFMIAAALGSLTRNVTQVLEARGAAARIFELLDRTPAIPTLFGSIASNNNGNLQPNSTLVPKTNSGASSVEFRNVSFSYPSRPNVPVLTNFNLTIKPNTSVALVGASGAGKSTVVALLQRFYDVTSGSILIDGVDIRTMDVRSMRRTIGYVQQEPQLFGLTVRENAAYGLDRRDDDDDDEAFNEMLYSACKKANAYDFVMAWPDGFDTVVGERGVKLSGGQKQRIAIARSILVNPKILVLDEATSALDAESEHLVQQAIDNACSGRTVLTVAHRLSTIRNADQIVVMTQGGLVDDIGTHDELMQRCETYQNLIKRQQQEQQKQEI